MRLLSTCTLANELLRPRKTTKDVAKHKHKWQKRVLSTRTMQMRLLSTRTIQMRLLSKRMMANEVAKHMYNDK